MRDAVPKMATFSIKIAKGEEIGSPREEGYIAKRN